MPPKFGGGAGDGDDNRQETENADKEDEDSDVLSSGPSLLTQLPVFLTLLGPGLHVQGQVHGEPRPLVQGAGGLAPGQTQLYRIATNFRVVEYLDTKQTTFYIG